jgi:hypothetical protein
LASSGRRLTVSGVLNWTVWAALDPEDLGFGDPSIYLLPKKGLELPTPGIKASLSKIYPSLILPPHTPL